MRTEYEQIAWNTQLLVAGIDEAGRGPLAGPCVVASVVFPIGFQDDRINDSKKLTPSKREALAEIIKDQALEIMVRIIDIETIDTLNIYQATKEAMMSCATSSCASYILTDAMPLIIEKPCVDIIKGDGLSVSIGAASIIAKTTRDQIMLEYDLLYPEYGFKKHKGYGTKDHIAALHKYGPTPIHRKSFHVRSIQQTTLDI